MLAANRTRDFCLSLPPAESPPFLRPTFSISFCLFWIVIRALVTNTFHSKRFAIFADTCTVLGIVSNRAATKLSPDELFGNYELCYAVDDRDLLYFGATFFIVSCELVFVARFGENLLRSDMNIIMLYCFALGIWCIRATNVDWSIIL